MNERRLEVAVQDAQDAFWDSIVKSYPEALSGDLSPHRTFLFDDTCEEVVGEWVENNAQEGDA